MTYDRFLTPAGAPSHAHAAVNRQMSQKYWTLQQVGPSFQRLCHSTPASPLSQTHAPCHSILTSSLCG